MTSLTGMSPNNPTRYLGANVALNTVVTRNRAPTGADYRMPETGKLYPFNTFWLVGKDPTTGTQGDLWYLSKIESNIGYWIQLDGAITNYYSLTPYIVGDDAHSAFTTISAAVTQAVMDGASTTNPKNIYIKPQNGGYVEDVVLSDGINLIGFGTQTVIHGKVSLSTAGFISVNDLTLQTNSDFAIEVAGSSASFFLCKGVNVNSTDNIGISFTSSNASSIVGFFNCSMNVATSGLSAYAMSSPGAMLYFRTDLQNGGLTNVAANNSAGVVFWQGCAMSCPHSTSGTGNLNISQCRMDCALSNSTCVTTSGTGSGNIFNSEISSGSSPCLIVGAGTTSTLSHVTAGSSATNVLTGAGTLNYAFIAFTGASSGHNVAVETAMPTI